MLTLNLDMSDVMELMTLDKKAQKAIQKAANELSAATRAHIVEEANKKLHTRRGPFIEALTHFQLDDHTWVVNLDASARWIDEGMSEHNMLEDLLKSKKAKRAADGSTYVVIPFQHNRTKQQMTPAQQSLAATIKKELAKVGELPNRLEMDKTGKPKMGMVRSMDIMSTPVRTSRLDLGHGPMGQVVQSVTGIPLLQGVRVYQKPFKDPKTGAEKVGRFVMTFRIASSKHKSPRWDHPGLEPTNLMEEGLKWAQEQWKKIAPGLVASITME